MLCLEHNSQKLGNVEVFQVGIISLNSFSINMANWKLEVEKGCHFCLYQVPVISQQLFDEK